MVGGQFHDKGRGLTGEGLELLDVYKRQELVNIHPATIRASSASSTTRVIQVYLRRNTL